MIETKIRRIGGSKGIIIPKDILEFKNWREDDTLILEPMGNGIVMRKAVE